MPLSIGKLDQLTKYATRILSNKNHPFSKIIKNYYHFNFYEISKLHLLAGNFFTEFQKLKINSDMIALILQEWKCKTDLTAKNQPVFAHIRKIEAATSGAMFGG